MITCYKSFIFRQHCYKQIFKQAMPKITPFLQEVVYIVADFLASIEHTKAAQKLKKQFELPAWVQKDNPLIKKGLKKVLKQYINENQKVLKYFKNRKPEEEEQEQSEEQQSTPKPTKKQRKSVSPSPSPLVKAKSPKTTAVVPQATKPKGWMQSQFQQPKRLQDLNYDVQPKNQQPQVVIPKKDKNDKKKKVVKQTSSEQSSQQTPQPKKQKKQIKKQKKQKKVKGPVDSSYLNSQEEFQLEDKKVKKSVTPEKKIVEKVQKKVEIVKKAVITRKQSAQIQEPAVQNGRNYGNGNYNNGQTDNGPKQFFSRINKDDVGFIPQNRRDNTFQAKARYGDGAGDSWGQFGHQKLKDTRGDSFKKTKGKLKNRAFQGSGINMDRINSVPIM